MEGSVRGGMLLVACGVLLVIVIPQTEATIRENIYVSGCSGNQMELQCPVNHRIAIKRLFFGVKRSWDCMQGQRKTSCCHATHTDCIINDDSKYPSLNTRCSGYQQCTLVVQRQPSATHCPGSQHTDYMTVIYDCVPDSDIAMFCSDDVKRGKLLYLSNMEYPSSVTEQKADCMCMVRTQGGAEGINIHSIDILLAWAEHGPRSCSKELGVRDEKGYRWNIQCDHRGYYGFRTIYTKPVQNVTLTLKSFSSKGSAFVWLQAKATDEEEQVEIHCGEPLRQILFRARQEVESRRRNRGDNSDRTTPPDDTGQAKNSTYPYTAHMGSLSSNLAAIIGGIVAAGFILIAIVIIAIAFHCKRVRQAKAKNKQSLNLYPAVTNGEATSLKSYCRYNEYDDDHYSTINRSPLKMASLTDSDIATHHARTNGFITLATAEAHAAQESSSLQRSEGDGSIPLLYPTPIYPTPVIRENVTVTPNPLPPSVAMDNAFRNPYPPPPDSLEPLPPPPPPIAREAPATLPKPPRDPLLSDPGYQGQMSLRYPRPQGLYPGSECQDGHKTLPDNRHKILVSGPKSPLGKRSKSVTFSQPVAMVTPLPSGSEESVGEGVGDTFGKGSPTLSLEDGNYDNLNKIVIPDHPMSPAFMHRHPLSPTKVHHPLPLSPTKIHTVPIQHHHGNQPGSPDYHSNGGLPRSLSTFRSEEDLGVDDGPYPLPPPPLPNGDTYAVVHKKPLTIPLFQVQPQNAQLYETGV